jgi:hypothetical protein
MLLSFHFLQDIPPLALHLSRHCKPVKVRFSVGLEKATVGLGANAGGRSAVKKAGCESGKVLAEIARTIAGGKEKDGVNFV